MRQLIACLVVLAVAGYVQGSVFSVGHGGYVAQDGKIWFRNILEDSDGSWNQYRGHFSCQDPGYYYISFHGLSRRGSALTLNLFKNYREVLAAFGDGSGYNTASNAAVLYLGRGDTISLHVVEGRVHESSNPSRNYITLSGFKIGDGFGSEPPRFPSGGGGSGFASASPGSGSQPGVASAAGAPGSQPQPGGTGFATAAAPEEGGEDGFKPLTPEAGGPN